MEAHNNGIVSHFGREKTLSLVRDKFYWLKLD